MLHRGESPSHGHSHTRTGDRGNGIIKQHDTEEWKEKVESLQKIIQQKNAMLQSTKEELKKGTGREKVIKAISLESHIPMELSSDDEYAKEREVLALKRRITELEGKLRLKKTESRDGCHSEENQNHTSRGKSAELNDDVSLLEGPAGVKLQPLLVSGCTPRQALTIYSNVLAPLQGQLEDCKGQLEVFRAKEAEQERMSRDLKGMREQVGNLSDERQKLLVDLSEMTGLNRELRSKVAAMHRQLESTLNKAALLKKEYRALSATAQKESLQLLSGSDKEKEMAFRTQLQQLQTAVQSGQAALTEKEEQLRKSQDHQQELQAMVSFLQQQKKTLEEATGGGGDSDKTSHAGASFADDKEKEQAKGAASVHPTLSDSAYIRELEDHIRLLEGKLRGALNDRANLLCQLGVLGEQNSQLSEQGKKLERKLTATSLLQRRQGKDADKAQQQEITMLQATVARLSDENRNLSRVAQGKQEAKEAHLTEIMQRFHAAEEELSRMQRLHAQDEVTQLSLRTEVKVSSSRLAALQTRYQETLESISRFRVESEEEKDRLRRELLRLSDNSGRVMGKVAEKEKAASLEVVLKSYEDEVTKLRDDASNHVQEKEYHAALTIELDKVVLKLKSRVSELETCLASHAIPLPTQSLDLVPKSLGSLELSTAAKPSSKASTPSGDAAASTPKGREKARSATLQSMPPHSSSPSPPSSLTLSSSNNTAPRPRPALKKHQSQPLASMTG